MRYLPHTDEDIASMLQAVGVPSLDDLFAVVPETCRRNTPLNLPEPMTEWELDAHMLVLANRMAVRPEYNVFVGAGSYEHHIPEAVSYLLQRSEFLTSYTPYQPEMSQGTLQAIYEYQTLVTRLLGMEVANASLYDGASALAEALLMAIRITGRKRIALSTLIHPFYRRVVETYFEPTGYELLELPRLDSGKTDLESLPSLGGLAAVAVQSPNFLGCIEDLQLIGQAAHAMEALFVTCFTEPLAYGVFKSPGKHGADIACGEGQSFGMPASFGGPGLGMLASKMQYVRNMPGRLIGETSDKQGRRGFVLTLATREQHIRREKATSNICTNNSLCALTAAMYLASLGGTGLRALARLNYDKAEYLKSEMKKAGFNVSFDSPTFNEFVVELPDDFSKHYSSLLKENIVAGICLAPFYPDLSNHYLFCVTETKTKEEMDALLHHLTNL
jgi:glycine dehydrogenase subunit 1